MTRTKLPALKRLNEAHQQMISDKFKLDGDPNEDGGVFASPTLSVLGRQDTVGVTCICCASRNLTPEAPSRFWIAPDIVSVGSDLICSSR